MGSDTETLLEPAKAYREQYKEAFRKNAEELYDRLVEKSAMPVAENRKTAEAYRKKAAEAEKAGKRLSLYRALRVLMIVLAVVAAVVAVIGIVNVNVWLIVIPAVVCVGILVFLFVKWNKVIREQNGKAEKLREEAAALLSAANEQIRPLLALFDMGMTPELVQKTVPTLVIDRNYHMGRFDYLHGKYGYAEQENDETSTVGLLSGEIVGNPFVVERTLRHRLGKQTYHGTLTIHWTTYSRQNGRTVAQHHTQVLHATVQKPKPFYSTLTRLIYGNDAAPDLSFTHEKTHAEKLSEKQLKKHVESGVKKLRKEAEKRVAEGFTEMGNEQFDVLFGGWDRDNEVQYRLLFTSLAQKNMLDIIKGGSPYGDDFRFRKQKCLNTVISEHAQDFDFDADTSVYRSYDVDLCKANFMKYNERYFRSLYFDLAPLLSVPLYQQNKPREYIYRDSYRRNYTARESEVLANRFPPSSFADPRSGTRAILKTELLEKNGDIDKLSVTAYSYRTYRRVDLVPVLGGDGRMHAVPVPWVEYVPVSRETTMQVRAMDMDEPSYRAAGDAGNRDPHVFFHRLFAMIREADLPPSEVADDRTEEERDFHDIDEKESEYNSGDIADILTDEINN